MKYHALSKLLRLFHAVCLTVILSSFLINEAAGDAMKKKYGVYLDEMQAAKEAFDKKDYQGAAEHYSNAIGILPTEAANYLNRGLALYKAGKEAEALKDYLHALEISPDDADVLNSAARLYAIAKDEKVRDKTKALEHARKAAYLSREGNADILDTLALAYFLNGKIKEAVEMEKKALKLSPNNDEFRKNLKLYEEAGKK